ncbi:MAG: hypothetical protein HYV76_00700 [Candidatus Vogelbacteria bacterium]|nr:hypothetical protein [Candidatus Vogelbacteria bacterium]
MNRFGLIGLIVVIIVVGLIAWQYEIPSSQTPTISDLNQNKVEPGTIRVEGYVVKKSIKSGNIIISQTNESLTDYTQLTDDDLIIYLDHPDRYNLGQKYTFELMLESYDSQGHPIYSLK